jgi:hypothetical protein
MSENDLTPRKYRRKKLLYLDSLTFVDGGIVLGAAFGIIVVIIIMILVLIDLYKMVW